MNEYMERMGDKVFDVRTNANLFGSGSDSGPGIYTIDDVDCIACSVPVD